MVNSLDSTVFFTIYNNLHSEVGDAIIPYFRDTYTWIPYFAFVFFVIYRKYDGSKFWIVVAIFILSIVISDQVSAHLLKPVFSRLRPCQHYDIIAIVPCGSGYSFPSAHASNFFTLSFLILFLFKNIYLDIVSMSFAILVGLAQVYVGVHYLSDIVGGALVGLIIAYLAQSICTRWMDKL